MTVGLMRVEPATCVDKVNGYTCDCDEDHELMLQVHGSVCVARNGTDVNAIMKVW